MVNNNLNIQITAKDSSKAAFDSVHKRTKTLKSSFMKWVATIPGTMKTMVRQMADALGLITARGVAGIGAAFAFLSKAIYQTQMQFDSFTNALVVSSGSLTSAKIEVESMIEELGGMGLELSGTMRSYSKFKIASKEAGMSSELATKSFIGISKASVAMGLSAQSSELALKALEQMLSKGNVQAEELRGQLGEHLPGAFGMAAEAMGVTTGELNKMLERGEVLATDLVPKLADVMENRFSTSWKLALGQGRVALVELSNAWLLLKREVAESGFGSFMISMVRKITDAMKSVTENFDSFMIDMLASVRSAVVVIGNFLSYTRGFFSAIGVGASALYNMMLNIGAAIGKIKFESTIKKDIETVNQQLQTAAGLQQKLLAAEQKRVAAELAMGEKRKEQSRLLNDAKRRELEASMSGDIAAQRAAVEEQKKIQDSYLAQYVADYRAATAEVEGIKRAIKTDTGVSISISDTAVDEYIANLQRRLARLKEDLAAENLVRDIEGELPEIFKKVLSVFDKMQIAIQGSQEESQMIRDLRTMKELIDKLGSAEAGFGAFIASMRQALESGNISEDYYDSLIARAVNYYDELLSLQQNYVTESSWWAKFAADQIAFFESEKGKAYMESANLFGSLGNAMMQGSRREFEIGKRLALASALIDGHAAAVAAYKAGSKFGPKTAAAFAALAIAKTGYHIKAIRSQNYGGGGTLGSSGSSGGSTEPQLLTPVEGPQRSDRGSTTINIVGNVIGTEEFVRNSLVPLLRTEIEQNDVVIFGSGSRQALEFAR